MTKRSRRNAQVQEAAWENERNTAEIIPIRKPPKPVVAKNENQRLYMESMRNYTVTIGTGPAGVGKTFLAGAYAAELLKNSERGGETEGKIERVIITRPAVETGPSMGFLPGTLSEKYAPFLEPFKQVIIDRTSLGHYTGWLKSEKILPQPLGHMRGATFKNAFVILDEAQNCTPTEMKMFLTRIGENCTVVVNGDIDQCDLHGPSGLAEALRRLSRIDGINVVAFTDEDCVRSKIVRDILRAWR